MTESFTSGQYLHRSPADLGCFVLVHQFKDGWRIGCSRIPFSPGLEQMSIESLRVPRKKGLAAEVRSQTKIAADDFTAYNRQIVLTCFLVTQHLFVFRS